MGILDEFLKQLKVGNELTKLHRIAEKQATDYVDGWEKGDVPIHMPPALMAIYHILGSAEFSHQFGVLVDDALKDKELGPEEAIEHSMHTMMFMVFCRGYFLGMQFERQYPGVDLTPCNCQTEAVDRLLKEVEKDV